MINIMESSKKLRIFIAKIFPLKLYVPLSILWVPAMNHLFLSMYDIKTPLLDLRICIGIVTVFLLLFYLRVMDEMKDYEYDKIYNLDRPLVDGSVSFSDLRLFAIVTICIVLFMNIFVSTKATIVLILQLFYTWLLIPIEKSSKRIRDDLILNLLVTHIVYILVSMYIYISFLSYYGISFDITHLLIILAFSLAFLQFEFIRKTSFDKEKDTEKRMYSNVLGTTGSIAAALLFQLCAAVLILFVLNHIGTPRLLDEFGLRFIFLICLIPTALILIRYLTEYGRVRNTKIYGVYGMCYLILFYLSCILQILVN